MNTKFISNNSNELIIFLMGWGSDDVQYKNMTSSKDLLICWDYTNLDFEFDFSNYEHIDLIAYSAGVFISGLIQNSLPKLRHKIAINGNSKMFDEYFGVDKKIVDIVYNLNYENCLEFRRKYLVFDDKELEMFSKNLPTRTFESCLEELNKLEEFYKKECACMDFDVAIISDNDKIFNFARQKEYYKDKYIILKNSAHNVFAKFKTYDEILDFAKQKLSK